MDNIELYMLNGRSLSDYGVFVLNGSHAEVAKYPNIKPLDYVNSKGINGVELVHKGGQLQDMQREIKLYLLIRGKDREQMLERYNNLFAWVLEENSCEIIIPLGVRTSIFKGCYKSLEVTKFYPSDNWIKCTLTLLEVDIDEYKI